MGVHVPSNVPGSSPALGRVSRGSLGLWSTAVSQACSQGWGGVGVCCVPASSTQARPAARQVMGTLFIYALFMVELLQDTPLERMDEIIYCVNAVSRVLEFLVALCVVAYGTWESLFGEWSWMGASVIIIHSYFNVWLRAQSGWRSFLLRREAAKKINSLPRATRGQLRDHNDVCAICFQVSPCQDPLQHQEGPILLIPPARGGLEQPPGSRAGPCPSPAPQVPPGDVLSPPAGHAGGRHHPLQPLLPRCLPPQVALRAGHVPHVPPAGHTSSPPGRCQQRDSGSGGAGPRGRGAGGWRSPSTAPGGRAAPWGQRARRPGGRQGLPG